MSKTVQTKGSAKEQNHSGVVKISWYFERPHEFCGFQSVPVNFEAIFMLVYTLTHLSHIVITHLKCHAIFMVWHTEIIH